MVVIINVNIANVKVNAIFPLTLAPFKIGIKPKILLIQIKKNTVNKYGIYLAYLCSPIIGLAISSLTKTTRGSTKPAIPLGKLLFDDLYFLAAVTKIKMMTMIETHIINTFLVIEKSNGFEALVG